jgi:hypothetical protein
LRTRWQRLLHRSSCAAIPWPAIRLRYASLNRASGVKRTLGSSADEVQLETDVVNRALKVRDSAVEVIETREGVCRLGRGFARELSNASHPLRAIVAPHAEWLARQLLNDAGHPTPLTRHRQKQSRAASR